MSVAAVLQTASSVLQQSGALNKLAGGQGESMPSTSSAATTTTQTFTTGSMGGGDSTVLYLIVAVVALYILTR